MQAVLVLSWSANSYVFTAPQSFKPRIFAHKYMTGYGHERGGVTVNIFNNMNESQEISYFDSVPWFLKLYLHTLKVSVLGNEHIHQNGKERERLYERHSRIAPMCITNGKHYMYKTTAESTVTDYNYRQIL